MKCNNEIIIFIEYHNGIPYTVFTEYSTFDFALYANSWLMFHESAIGKNWEEKDGKKIFELELSYCEPREWEVWIDSQYTFVPENQKGVTILKKPIMLPVYYDGKEKNNNPFVVGEEVDEIYWCEKCQCHYHEDGCPDHGYEENEE